MLGLGTNIIKADLYSTLKYTSANFDGTDDFFTVPDNDAISFSNSPGFGISMWLNLNDGVNHGILQKGEEYKLHIESNGRIHWMVTDDSENKLRKKLSSIGAFAFDEWVHLNLEFGIISASPRVSIYINSIEEIGVATNETGFVAPENTSADLLIGKASTSVTGTFGTPNVVMNGNMTNLVIYNGSLTSEQRSNLYGAGPDGYFFNEVWPIVAHIWPLISNINTIPASNTTLDGSAASGQEPTFTTI